MVLSLSLRCTNDVVKAGDETSIEFKITNRGTNDYKYADRTYDRSGRMDEYKLVAKTESGESVPGPRAKDRMGFGGGGFQYQILKPGQSFTKIIPLNHWALLKEPGRYAVTGTYYSESFSTNAVTTISDPLTVTIKPRTEKEMDEYIGNLTNQIASLSPKQIYPYGPYPSGSTGPTPELDDLLMKLTFTCNPKIIPTLLDTVYKPGHGGFWESEAILDYVPRSEKIRKDLIEAAAKRGLGANWTISYLLKDYGCTKEEIKPIIERALMPENEQDWSAGAGLAQQFSDDDFTTRLIAIATTPRINAQNAAIEALAFNRTDEGVITLNTLLNDPDAKISKMTEDAIHNAYTSRGNARGVPLRPEDFDAKLRAPK
jgi:hypothetical protein